MIREDESIKKTRLKKLHLHSDDEGEEEICDHHHSDEETPPISEIDFKKEERESNQRILS
jgi:hypothetical protein